MVLIPKVNPGRAFFKEVGLNIDFSAIPYNQIVWWALVILGIVAAIVIFRFFWRHLLKYIFQGCLVLLLVIALIELLHYLKVF
jgi:hypothetical protein